jgi:hypothetical protein
MVEVRGQRVTEDPRVRPISKVLLVLCILCVAAIYGAQPLGYVWAPEVRTALVVTAVGCFVLMLATWIQAQDQHPREPRRR